MKKKIILSLLCLMLILLCVLAPFWAFSLVALPVIFFTDICNILLPIIALSILGLSISAYFTRNYARFNNIVGILALVMIVTVMNLFIESVKLSFVVFLFVFPLLLAYWIYKKNDIRYYLLVFPVIILVIIPIMYLWFRDVV